MMRLPAPGYRPLTLILLLALSILPQDAAAQLRAGAAFLKSTPGARQEGLAGTLTGALDNGQSFYANPGALGFMREWQWSATYTKWIPDVYNASLILGHSMSTPWSRHTRFVLGMNYMGIPEFNSAGDAGPPVSGNDLLVTLGIGQPLTGLSPRLSLGASFKCFTSKLATYSASSWVTDLGLLFRTPRFDFISPGNGFLDEAIISAGVAVTQMGPALEFIDESTPLPRTVRAGLALAAGTHNGLQFNIGADYRLVRDEEDGVSIGSEISWNQWLTIRGGYNFADNLLGHLAFGASLRLDDQTLGFGNTLPGRNNGMRLDLSSREGNDFFSTPYHGSLSHHPIGPEGFEFVTPALGDTIRTDSVRLIWQSSRDPDLFDDVSYRLMVDQDSTRLAEILESADRYPGAVLRQNADSTLLVGQDVDELDHVMDVRRGGDYFWAVMASDLDDHVRFAKTKGERIACFHVTMPDLKILALDFDYDTWITEDDYQGELSVIVANVGARSADETLVAIDGGLSQEGGGLQLLGRGHTAPLAPGQTDTLHIPWHTTDHGRHQITARVDVGDEVREYYEDNNTRSEQFFTIPKGSFRTVSLVTIAKITEHRFEVPFIGKVFFDTSSAYVDSIYVDNWLIEPPLVTLAKRLQANPDMTVSVKGTADPTPIVGEADPALADMRAESVRDALVSLGVDAHQIRLQPGKQLPVRRRVPRDPDDARWVFEDRRQVEISADSLTEATLFHPRATSFLERTPFPVPLAVNIRGAVPLRDAQASLALAESTGVLGLATILNGSSLLDTLDWTPPQPQDPQDPGRLEDTLEYSLTLEDDLGRRFRTHARTASLTSDVNVIERLYFGIGKFAGYEPVYEFYWDRLVNKVLSMRNDDSLRMKFVGHACATGTEDINLTYSMKRAKLFHDKLLAQIKKEIPKADYDRLISRIDPVDAKGEKEEYYFLGRDGKRVVLGEKEIAVGRELDRRVEVHFYTAP